jgi:flagellar P-ring protein FlgI
MRSEASNMKVQLAAAMIAATALWAPLARAEGTAVRDIVHLQGARQNKLMATSLVVGLGGTGDTKSLETLRSLAYMLRQYGHDGVVLEGINTANVALVQVTATIPEQGARNGDRLDVRVASLNGAKSLKGGRLVQCTMLGPMATPISFALADGDVILEDPKNATVGTIKGGAVMERDFTPTYMVDGKITLVMEASHARWAIATTVAKIINDAEGEPGKPIAVATGPAQVVVTVPTVELAASAGFITRILDLPVLMPDLEACIVINRRTGTIMITSDVQIDPVVFSQDGLTITTVTPEPAPTAAQPKVVAEKFQVFAAGPTDKESASARRLIEAFNRLAVPVDDQIAVIWTLQKTGRLHAKVIEE